MIARTTAFMKTIRKRTNEIRRVSSCGCQDPTLISRQMRRPIFLEAIGIQEGISFETVKQIEQIITSRASTTSHTKIRRSLRVLPLRTKMVSRSMANHGKKAAAPSTKLRRNKLYVIIRHWTKQASTRLYSQKSETKLLREDIVGVSSLACYSRFKLKL
jgi:hypothetical protein